MNIPTRHLRLALPAVLALLSCSCATIEKTPTNNTVAPKPELEPVALAASAEAREQASPLTLSVQESILVGLENNPGLDVQRLTPLIRSTAEGEALSEFDPTVAMEVAGSRQDGTTKQVGGIRSRSNAAADINVASPLGSTLGIELDSERSSAVEGVNSYATRAGLTASQALLRGRGTGPNLAAVRVAQVNTRISEYELRGFAQNLVADIERTYWDYVYAQRQIAIFEESLALANRQLEETSQRIAVGAIAETELTAAEAEVALRREGLINARSNLETSRLRLLRLINPPGEDPLDRQLTPADEPELPPDPIDPVEDHLRLAMIMRPDLNQARLSVQRGEYELVQTRNGLLPRMDLFISLGQTGYAESFTQSVDQWREGEYDFRAGVRLEYALGNRAARSRHERATYTREQARLAVDNLLQLAQVDVRAAHIEVRRALEQITATSATRKLQEEKVRAETEKFRVGRSTSLLVASAQRDLIASRLSETQAYVNALKAFVELYNADGTLLDRRGVVAPGEHDMPAP